MKVTEPENPGLNITTGVFSEIEADGTERTYKLVLNDLAYDLVKDPCVTYILRDDVLTVRIDTKDYLDCFHTSYNDVEILLRPGAQDIHRVVIYQYLATETDSREESYSPGILRYNGFSYSGKPAYFNLHNDTSPANVPKIFTYVSPGKEGQEDQYFCCAVTDFQAIVDGISCSEISLSEGKVFDDSKSKPIAYIFGDANETKVIAIDCEIPGRFWHNSLEGEMINPSHTIKEPSNLFRFTFDPSPFLVRDVITGKLHDITIERIEGKGSTNPRLTTTEASARNGIKWDTYAGSVGFGANCLPYPCYDESLDPKGFTRLVKVCERYGEYETGRIWDNPYTSIEEVADWQTDAQPVIVTDGLSICVHGNGEAFNVYDLTGILRLSGQADGMPRTLPSEGIYIINGDNIPSRKIAVK